MRTDLFKFVKMWRRSHALKVLQIFNNIFGDVEVDLVACKNVTAIQSFSSLLGDEWLAV